MSLESFRNLAAVPSGGGHPRLVAMAPSAEDAGFAPPLSDTMAASGDVVASASASVKDLPGPSVVPGVAMPSRPGAPVHPVVPSAAPLPDTPARLALTFDAVVANVRSSYVGKDVTVRLALCCLMAEGHLLVEDHPGVGKTTLAKALARSLGLTFGRVQFTADLLPSDVTGAMVFDRDSGQIAFRPGPGVHQPPVGGRAQPGLAQSPVGAAGVDGGAPGQRGRRQPPVAAAVHGDRHPEPL